jgi:hypothetical protein
MGMRLTPQRTEWKGHLKLGPEWRIIAVFSYGNSVMGKRPPHVKAPAYLSKNPPVPDPQPMVRGEEPDPKRPDPVRYGDWELKGVAVDF